MTGINNKSALSRLLKIAVSNGVENAVKVHIAKGDDLNACDDVGDSFTSTSGKECSGGLALWFLKRSTANPRSCSICESDHGDLSVKTGVAQRFSIIAPPRKQTPQQCAENCSTETWVAQNVVLSHQCKPIDLA